MLLNCRECGNVVRNPSKHKQWHAEDLRRFTMGLAQASGMDITVCEFCEEPLEEDDSKDERPWRRGLDGAGAHDECLRSMGLIRDEKER